MPLTVFHSLSATTPDDPTYEIRPSHWNSGHAATINAVGSEVSGAFSNGGNVTFGLSANGFITASAPAGGGGALTISGAGSSISAGQLIFSNLNGVSFGMNGSTMTASVAAAGGAQTGISSVAVGGTVYTSGSIQFVNSNNFSFLSTTGQGIVGSFSTSQSVQTQASGNIPRSGFTTNATAGVVLAGTNDTAGLNLGVPAWLTTAAQSSVSNISAISAATNNAGGGTATLSGGVSFTNANSVTFYTSAGNAIAASFSYTNPTSYVSSINGSSGGISLAVGSSLSASSNASTITFGLASNITTALQSAGAYLTTAAQSSLSNVSQIIAATNNTGGGTITLTGGVSFSNANGLTFYTSVGNAIVGSYSVPTQSADTLSLLVAGNTTGQSSASTFDARTFNVSAAGIASMGWSNGSLIVSVPIGGGAGDGVNIVSVLTNTSGGGTAGATFSAISASIGLMAGSNITLSQTSNTIVINGPAAPAVYTGSWFVPEVWGNTLTSAHANGTMYIRPLALDAYYDIDYYVLQQSFASSASTFSFAISNSTGASWSSSGTGSWGQTGTILLFSRVQTDETGASYNSILSFDSKTYSMAAAYSVSLGNISFSAGSSGGSCTISTQAAITFVSSIDTGGGVTYGTTSSSTTTGFSFSSTNQNSSTSSFVMSFPYAHMSAIRPVFAPGSGSALPPGAYWIGIIQSTATGSTNYSLQRIAMMSNPGMLYFTGSSNNSYLEIGNSANVSRSNYRLGFGSYSASSNTTGQIPLSAVTSMSSNASLWLALAGQTR